MRSLRVLLAASLFGSACCYRMPGALRRKVAPAASPAFRARVVAQMETQVPEQRSSSSSSSRSSSSGGDTSSIRRSGSTDGSSTEALMATLEEHLNNTWYAVAYSSDIDGDLPFATRLFGEPMVLYRDADGEATCVRDVCPHRSAPLSMGEVKDGVLRCFYHGWGFGKEGSCVSVPTNRQGSGPSSMPKNFCATSYAVVERDGLLWVWRGNTLGADLEKLPALAAETEGEGGIWVDTVLDYDCDWTILSERPPLGAFAAKGTGSAAANSDTSAVPYIARHMHDASGVVTEAHIKPIAPNRARVLLRQRLPDSPLLALLVSLPGGLPLLNFYVRNANSKVAMGDYLALTQQAATTAEDSVPYFTGWDGLTARERRYGEQIDDEASGTYGLKRNYLQSTPRAAFAPMAPGELNELLARLRSVQNAVAGAIVSVPAALVTYKTVGPAMATIEMFGKGGS